MWFYKIKKLVFAVILEFYKIKLSDLLISYMLNITASESTMKFQVYKKVAKFTKLKNSLEILKKYMIYKI